jgi:hypothetical protein
MRRAPRPVPRAPRWRPVFRARFRRCATPVRSRSPAAGARTRSCFASPTRSPGRSSCGAGRSGPVAKGIYTG